MDTAVACGHTPVVKCLVKEGGVDIDFVGEFGYSVLFVTADRGNYRLFQWLIKEGAHLPTAFGEAMDIETQASGKFLTSGTSVDRVMLPLSCRRS
jgi:hypothetical protein